MLLAVPNNTVIVTTPMESMLLYEAIFKTSCCVYSAVTTLRPHYVHPANQMTKFTPHVCMFDYGCIVTLYICVVLTFVIIIYYNE